MDIIPSVLFLLSIQTSVLCVSMYCYRKKTEVPPTVGGNSVFFFRRKWFSLTIIAQRAFPCCILVISWMSLFTPPWKLTYYGLWRRLFIPVLVLAVLFLSDQMPILTTTYFTTLQSGSWSRCHIVNEDMKIK